MKNHIWLLFFTISLKSFAQLGGSNGFGNLSIPVSALQAGTGGINASNYCNDGQIFLASPALLNKSASDKIGFTYNPYFADVSNNTVSFVKSKDTLTTFAGALNFTNYGNFNSYDAGGNSLGNFTASSYYLAGSASHKMANFSIGATIKYIGQRIDTYNASAIGADLGAVFIHPSNNLRLGLVAKNIGFQLSSFAGKQTNLPLDVQLGLTYKLTHMPLRFTVTAQQLNRWDITYLNPTAVLQLDGNGKPVYGSKSFFDNLSRRFVFGGEFLLSQNVNIRVGYNHLINRELKLQNVSGAAGLSLGAMIKIKAFEIAYSHAWYGPTGGAAYITLAVALDKLYNNKSAVENINN